MHALEFPVSWQYVDTVTGYEPNLYSWAPRSAIALNSLAPGTRLYSVMDYKQFALRGEEYFKELNTAQPAWYELQKAHASIGFRKEQQAAKEALSLGLITNKYLQLGDIRELLEKNYIIALVDAGKLNGWGFSMGHFVFVYGEDGTDFLLHDPGFPRKKAWRVPKWLFMTAFENELISIPR